ncbi:hypothetical protein ABRQ22_17365 [Cellulosimicrobium sp. ES-005]|uniref:Uncharacterized protein n=1 Tax=Cellulosimicrobium sp. ES-005 TaxID=3163031 RepID=A0AAU8FZN8_9MICO
MRDTCLACGRPIFTTALRVPIVTLAQQWTHGSRRIDRKHAPIPTNHDFEVIR